MAEVGLVPFAQTALHIGKATLPNYKTKFSKHLFTQPQLLVILCLMRYEDWTFRQAEVRLAEHYELRYALELAQVPDYSTVYRFMRRLDDAALTHVLAQTVAALPAPRETTTVAVDATGLASGSISTFFIKRAKDRGEGLPWRSWTKWIVAVDVERRAILAQMARQGPWNDGPSLRPLVRAAHQLTPVHLVLADAEFDSDLNHKYVRQQIGAQSIIPAKRGKKTWNIKGIRREMRDNFPASAYGQRSLVESVFSAVKRKLSAKAPGRSVFTQQRQALLLGIAYNLYLV